MRTPAADPIQQRIQCLDSLRGLALFGILLSIINGFNLSLPFADAYEGIYNDPLSRLWSNLHELLIAQRFIAIFSFLFGVGIAIQQANHKSRGAPFAAFYLRRMLLLGAFGLINTIFFWWGEILLVYAIFGLLLTLFFKANFRLLITAAVLVYVVIHPIWVVHFSEGFSDSVRGAFYETYRVEDLFRIYREGSFFEMAAARWREYIALFTVDDQWLRTSFSLILVGYAVAKYKYLHTFIRRIGGYTKWLILTGMVAGIFSLIAWNTGIFYVTLNDGPPFVVANSLWLLSCTYFYIHLFILLYEKSPLRTILNSFSWVGRMSLSNYMLGALIYSLIFHNYGLGLYAKMPAWTEAPIALGVFTACITFSSYWLTRYRFGPLEWVWRSVSYWHRQPIKR